VPLDVVRLALNSRHERQELEHLARRDGLTGLANRRAFFGALDQLAAGDQLGSFSLAVLYVDLDDFKPVNDTHGHDVGDRVLEGLAERFRGSVRPDDLVARLGGDEFAVLCTGISSSDEAMAVAARLFEAAAVPFDTDAGRVVVGASIGVACVADSDLGDLRHVLNAADEALLRAKRRRKGTVELTVLD
jgi:diguanylate cyclase (GGDEF)-like protein